MGDVTHMDELLVARGEQDCGMGRRMSRRRYIVHAGCDFAALLHEPGSVGDRWQVLPSRGNRALLERVGHRRTVDLAFVAGAGPVIPLRIDKDELSLRKRQRARFRHQAADMIQVTVRRHDQIYALGRGAARRKFASSPGKLPKVGPSFSPKPLSTRIRSRPVSTTNGLAVIWITGCMKFAFNTGASSASEALITRLGPTGICP